MTTAAKLCQAAFDGDADLVLQLLRNGADINQADTGWNPIHSAVENDQLELVKILLVHNADREWIHSGMTPLAHAVEVECDGAIQQGLSFTSCNLDIISLLLGSGCEASSGLAMAVDMRNDHIKNFIVDHQNLQNKSQHPITAS